MPMKVRLKYLGGHPDLAGPRDVDIERQGDSLKIGPLLIPKDRILGLNMDRGHTRSLGKAAAGAAVGAVLTGGIGALAGAVIGGRSRDNSTIVLTVQDWSGAAVNLLLTGPNATVGYSQLAAMLG